MQLPNVASLAIIAAVIAAIEFVVAGADDLATASWQAIAVLVLGAIAKALQVYLQRAEAGPASMSADGKPQAGAVRRWLLG